MANVPERKPTVTAPSGPPTEPHEPASSLMQPVSNRAQATTADTARPARKPLLHPTIFISRSFLVVIYPLVSSLVIPCFSPFAPFARSPATQGYRTIPLGVQE